MSSAIGKKEFLGSVAPAVLSAVVWAGSAKAEILVGNLAEPERALPEPSVTTLRVTGAAALVVRGRRRRARAAGSRMRNVSNPTLRRRVPGTRRGFRAAAESRSERGSTGLRKSMLLVVLAALTRLLAAEPVFADATYCQLNHAPGTAGFAAAYDAGIWLCADAGTGGGFGWEPVVGASDSAGSAVASAQQSGSAGGVFDAAATGSALGRPGRLRAVAFAESIAPFPPDGFSFATANAAADATLLEVGTLEATHGAAPGTPVVLHLTLDVSGSFGGVGAADGQLTLYRNGFPGYQAPAIFLTRFSSSHFFETDLLGFAVGDEVAIWMTIRASAGATNRIGGPVVSAAEIYDARQVFLDVSSNDAIFVSTSGLDYRSVPEPTLAWTLGAGVAALSVRARRLRGRVPSDRVRGSALGTSRHPRRGVDPRPGLLVGVTSLLLASVLHAATLEITDFVDDANPANGTCTLREALRAANDDVAVDACPAGQSAFVDEILVPPGVHLVNLGSGHDEDLGITGDLDIRGAVRIRGAGSDYSIIDGRDAGANDRLFHILDLAEDVAIERVTLRGGNAADTSKRGGVLWNQETGPNGVELSEVEIRDGIAGSGGGIFNEGNLVIRRSRILENRTTVVPSTAGNHGGGLASSGASAQLHIEDSEIRANTAEEDGAGLWIAAGPFALYRSQLTDNVAGNAGGALHVASNGYDVQYVEFARNRAAAGAGVYLDEQGEIQRSAFVANQATATGGGVHDAFGGFVRFSTLTLNSAPLGAGIYAHATQTLLDSDTIASNAGGGVHNQSGVFFENTLLSANTGGNCTGAPPAFGAFNLDSANSCQLVSTPTAPNLPHTQPLLGPLADNGGPTRTLALLPGSLAIDFVTSEIRTNCQTMFDQRGHPRGRPRSQNGVGEDVFLCDIGAYEATTPFVVDTLADGADADLADDRCATSSNACTLRAAIQQANAIPGLDEIRLGAGAHVLSIAGAGEDAGQSGDLDIVPPLAIRGASFSLSTVDGANLDRVFHVGPVPPATTAAPTWSFFRDLAITGGNAGPDNGGGLATRGPTRLERVRLTNNQGQLGSAISTSPTGFFFLADLAPVEIFESTLESNPGGGAVFIADAVVERSSLIENVASAGNGGAGEFGRVRLRNSTVSGNQAPGQGAFFANAALIENSTIYDNTALFDTGGVFLLELSVLRNSVIANNRAAGSLQNCSMNPGAITSLGYNLTDGDGLDCGLSDLMSDQLATNPSLGALANNGGPTRTHLPAPGSPAIDRGDPIVCPSSDQRGHPRPLDGDSNGSFRCDIGSVEVPEPGVLAQIVAGGIALAGLSRRRVASSREGPASR